MLTEAFSPQFVRFLEGTELFRPRLFIYVILQSPDRDQAKRICESRHYFMFGTINYSARNLGFKIYLEAMR